MAKKPRQVRQSDLDPIAGALIRARGAIVAFDAPNALEAVTDAERYLAELRESGLIDDENVG